MMTTTMTTMMMIMMMIMMMTATLTISVTGKEERALASSVLKKIAKAVLVQTL